MKMNQYEIGLYVMALIGLIGYLSWRFRRLPVTAGLLALAAGPLYLAIERTTQFLTFDEPYYMFESMYIENAKLFVWFQWLGGLRTTDTIFGSLSYLRSHILPDMTDLSVQMTYKSIHWLLGFIVFIAIYHVIDDHWFKKPRQPVVFFLWLIGFVFLPSHLLTLKTYSYDTLSLGLGLLAIVMILVALKTDSLRWGLASVIVAFFSAQEKIHTSFILLAVLIVYVALAARKAHGRQRFVRLGLHLLLSIGSALAISGLEALILVIRRDGLDAPDLIAGIPGPFITWIWPLASFSSQGEIKASQTFLLLVVTIAVIVVAAAILTLSWPWLEKRLKLFARLAARANLVLLAATIIAGLIGLFTVRGYISPMVPVESGYYQPTGDFNGRLQHYRMRTWAGHVSSHIAVQYSQYLADIPTAYWLLITVGVVSAWQRRKENDPDPIAEVLMLAGLVMPLAFGLLQVPYPHPPSSRYMNIGLGMFAIAVFIKSSTTLVQQQAVRRWGFSIVVAALIVAEILPFRPLFGPFRPIWANQPTDRMPTAGVAGFYWGGWGENMMLAGNLLAASCGTGTGIAGDQNCKDIELYLLPGGIWLNEESRIQRPNPKFVPLGYEETDYYLLDRTQIETGWPTYSLLTIDPIYIFEYRGYPFAWLYRGSDLNLAE